MTVVFGGYHVSDQAVVAKLEAIAKAIGPVKVTSGDRNFIPRGGAKHSLHLLHRAADFHIVGMSDSMAFDLIRQRHKEIFGDRMEFQVIRHGPHTQTQGAHIHLGHPEVPDHRVGYMVEGLTPETKGIYQKVPGPL